ncbi:hypothetical protein RFI_08985 [Reticulomyxa filosa]|uniref:Uncharacterized protein n=1 Tax=Reticulomyxa filosa TaxID=46433 RepID=X6NQ43_RETFI|nr:hypothetical protein RFI_08985 [Reticulomyxa filosa]|eukprot:ETO28146.1 hypothetical protein RFI_08985 [Reticulomyxa filosa]
MLFSIALKEEIQHVKECLPLKSNQHIIDALIRNDLNIQRTVNALMDLENNPSLLLIEHSSKLTQQQLQKMLKHPHILRALSQFIGRQSVPSVIQKRIEEKMKADAKIGQSLSLFPSSSKQGNRFQQGQSTNINTNTNTSDDNNDIHRSDDKTDNDSNPFSQSSRQSHPLTKNTVSKKELKLLALCEKLLEIRPQDRSYSRNGNEEDRKKQLEDMKNYILRCLDFMLTPIPCKTFAKFWRHKLLVVIFTPTGTSFKFQSFDFFFLPLFF